MRLVFYYIAGLFIGIGLVAVILYFNPDDVQAVRIEEDPSVQTAATDVQSLNRDISIGRQNAITMAVKAASPAVVGINVLAVREYRYRNPFFEDPFFRQFFPDQVIRKNVENVGSGFIISPDGYVLTNEHVVHAATQIVVTTTDGQKYDAQIAGFDFESDVALLKINATDLNYIPFGNSDEVIIGEWAIAIGNPFGLFSIHAQPTVTVGVVSAVDRDFELNADSRLYQDMIQTDASINRGNSGGPLINSAGELIGMNTMIFTEVGGSIGLGFTIPSNRLLRIFNELKERGHIDRDFWTGIEIRNVDRLIAMSLRLPEASGVVVTDVEKGSPAFKAGLEPTDVIVKINDYKVMNTIDIDRFFRSTDLRVGDVIKLSVFRGGGLIPIEINLEKKDES